MKDEAALLRRYAEEGSQTAFTELVREHVDLVYGAALRRTGGDAHLAADVAQQVFTSLARNARKLSQHTVLSAWLHTATRNAALNLVISEQRRKAREQAAFALEPPGVTTPEPNWDQVRPVLDAAIDELPESDRAAVVLRFLERRPFAEIGTALRVSEDAARMRTERALDKLRSALARRGITSTAAALGAIVAAQPLVSAPAGLAVTFASTALATCGTSSGALAGIILLMNTKLVTAGVSALLAFGTGLYFGTDHSASQPVPPPPETPQHTQTIASLREENDRLKTRVSQLDANIGQLNAALAQQAASPTQVSQPTPGGITGAAALIGPRFLAYKQQRAMYNNLRQILAARDQHRLETKRLPNSVAELVGEKSYIKRITPVDGEDYSTLSLADGGKLSVTSADGVTATVDVNTAKPEGMLTSPFEDLAKELAQKVDPAAKKALEAYKLANGGNAPADPKTLLPYFTSPQDAADFFDYLEAVKVARIN